MIKHALLLLLVVFLSGAAPKRPVVDVYHGVKVSEDYRWLEDGDAAEVRDWSAAQTAQTRASLDKIPARAAAKERIAAYYKELLPSYFDAQWRKGRLFALKLQPPKNQPMLVVLKSPDDLAGEKVLVDPNAMEARGHLSIDWYAASLDGAYAAVAMSEKGSEDAALYFYDAATGKELFERVPRVNYPTAGGSAAWTADNKSVYYTRYPQGTERAKEDLNFYQQVYLHKLGTPAASDVYVLGKDFPRIAEIQLEMRADGRALLASVANGDGGEYAHYLMGADGRWTQLTHFTDKVVSAALGADGAVYLISRQNASRGKILRRTEKGTETIVPEGETTIENRFTDRTLLPTKTKLYAVAGDGGPSAVQVYDLAGKPLGTMPLPPVPSVQEIAAYGDDDALVRVQTYIEPSAWHKFSRGKVSKTALATKAPINFDDAEVTREFAISKDGTKVPMSVIRTKGLKLDGKNPALLTAYGGYGIINKPRFLGIRGRLWLDAGGVYVVGNIRGGGEYGEDWHLAGNLTKKQNVFEDFIACAKTLFDRGYTSADRLAIEGGSNGGLLMGAVLTQQPKLFRAVVSHVGIYDSLREELNPNGAFNTTEFGTVKDLEQFKALYAYSPYHHVVDGAAYPAVFLLTGEHDGRVNPYNSRKMAARLQAATSSGKPVLLRVSLDSGHGMGTALSETIEEQSDVHAFLSDQLGLPAASK